ncbi:uncharacterized protein LOC141711243 [Apium graveolens]|uniref:uncharacterized protein LOC141711243 n=1 Tax=Apium graveolens TaxID=4045 RepID=UPI003D7AA664
MDSRDGESIDIVGQPWLNDATDPYVPTISESFENNKGLWSSVDNTSMWKKMWRIKAPPKTLNLLWRAMSRSLPTKVQLQHRHVPVLSSCPVCENEDETAMHILIFVILLNFVGSCSSQCFYQFSVRTLRVGWSKPCKSVMLKQERSLPLCVGLFGKREMIEFGRTKKLVQIMFSHHPCSIFYSGRMPKVRILYLSLTIVVKVMGRVFGLNLKEVIAIRETLGRLKHKQWSGVVVESDCLVAIQAIRSQIVMVSPFDKVVATCRNLLEELATTSLFFVKRSANEAAHYMARESYSFPDRVLNRSTVPIELLNILQVDSSN